MIKVIHITASSSYGGGPKHIYDQLNGQNTNIEAYIACPNDNKPVWPSSILYATEKIINTPILQNKVSANEEGKRSGKNNRDKIKKKYKINL